MGACHASPATPSAPRCRHALSRGCGCKLHLSGCLISILSGKDITGLARRCWLSIICWQGGILSWQVTGCRPSTPLTVWYSFWLCLLAHWGGQIAKGRDKLPSLPFPLNVKVGLLEGLPRLHLGSCFCFLFLPIFLANTFFFCGGGGGRLPKIGQSSIFLVKLQQYWPKSQFLVNIPKYWANSQMIG